MKTLQIDYPESIPAVLNLSPEAFEQEARFVLAVKLFELGRLTSGQAAELAGISRVAFLLNCKRYGAATVDWDQTEIDEEFKDKKNMSGILVCNTGPLIAFSLINRLDILRTLFDVIAIPEEVRYEVLQGGAAGGKLAMWKEPEWISVRSLSKPII